MQSIIAGGVIIIRIFKTQKLIEKKNIDNKDYLERKNK